MPNRAVRESRKVYQAIAVILSQSSAAAGWWMAPSMTRNRWGQRGGFEFAEKTRTVSGRIRENGIQFFRAPAFDAEYLWRFRNGVVPGWQRLLPCSGDPNESLNS